MVIARPVITAENVITVPTDRSMPAVMMMKVTPRASTPLTAVASKMPMMLSGWQNRATGRRKDKEDHDQRRKGQQLLRGAGLEERNAWTVTVVSATAIVISAPLVIH
jgi:hypothetical protein